jgi:starvation-inducible DNA-binding protein
MEELIQSTKIVLANHFAFYLKAQYYHWNVTGPDFKQYHDLFGGVYEEVYGSIDKIAEEIRALDAYAPGSLGRFIQLSEVKDEGEVPPALEMVQRLYADIPILLNSIERAYELAEEQHQHGLSNFLAERQDAFKKHQWMLKSTLKT